MKKLLFVSTTPSSFHEPMLRAFKQLGFIVSIIDFRDNPILKTDNLIHKLVGKMPSGAATYLKNAANKSIALKILKFARTFSPDFVVFVRFPEMDLAILDELRKLVITINYYPETMDQWGLIKKIAPHYDYFLNYDSLVVELLNKAGIGRALYVPFSADLDPTTQWSAPEKFKYNITFIGTYYKKLYAEREVILNAVKDLGMAKYRALMRVSLCPCRFRPSLFKSALVVLISIS